MSRSTNLSPICNTPHAIKPNYASKYVLAFFMVKLYGGNHSYNLFPKISKRRCKKAYNKLNQGLYDYIMSRKVYAIS